MEKTDIKVYEFEQLKSQPDIVHGIFTRLNTEDNGVFDPLNTGRSLNLTQSVVENNKTHMVRKWGEQKFVFLNQVHGNTIKLLKNHDTDLPENFELNKKRFTADGIVTDMKNVFLTILVADCQAVMFYDPVKKIIANIHSGWRGSVADIIGKCIDTMINAFACRPEDIIAAVSPSLGPCCSEFVNYKDEIPENLWKYKTDNSTYFNFWKMSEDQLIKKGIKKENIENMQICTKCNTDIFYSFRGEQTTDRFACVISMI